MSVEDYSPIFWVLNNKICNEKGEPLDFNEHFFQYDIYREQSPELCIKKCSQVGLTVWLNLRMIHFAQKRGLGSIVTMPSDDDVSDFVASKLNPIIQKNKVIKDSLTEDSVSLKGIGDAFMHIRGTHSKSAPVSTTCDILAHDELDRSDLHVVDQYSSRNDHSKNPFNWKMSNPSLEKIGIDAEWEKSDQREWVITCGACKEPQTLTWPDSINAQLKCFVCKNCGKPLATKDRGVGVWQPQKPGARIRGYHISQLMAPWFNAERILKKYEDQAPDVFFNFTLGEPYRLSAMPSFRQIITDCWTEKKIEKGPFFMGIDIGIEKHYMIGTAEEIFEVDKVLSREQLQSKIETYNPVVVMDAGPERTWAEEFKKKYPKLFLCFLNRDKQTSEIARWGGDKGTEEDLKNWGYVWADRSRLIDKVVMDMLEGKTLIGVPRDVLEKFIRHWESMRRVIVDTPDGGKRYVWESASGLNHWALAQCYYWLARSRGAGKSGFLTESNPKKPIIEVTKDGFRMNSLEELFNQNNNF